MYDFPFKNFVYKHTNLLASINMCVLISSIYYINTNMLLCSKILVFVCFTAALFYWASPTPRTLSLPIKWVAGYLGIYALHLCSMAWAGFENIQACHHHFELKAQFMAIPLFFLLLPPLKINYYYHIFTYFIALTVLLSIVSVAFFFMQNNYTANFELIQSGSSIPTPIDHIRTSLLVVYAIFLCFFIGTKKNYTHTLPQKIFYISSFIILTLFLHFLAARTGLVIFYSFSIFYSIHYALKNKKILPLLLMPAALIALAIATYYTMPSLYYRIGYTLYDLGASTPNTPQYSIGGRLLSYEVGWNIFLQNPLFGTSIATAQQTIEQYYHTHYPQFNKILHPHNQFLTYAFTFGSIGLSIFLISFYYPLYAQKNYKNKFIFLIFYIITLSFLTENTLEIQIGLTISLFFIFFTLHMAQAQKKHNPK